MMQQNPMMAMMGANPMMAGMAGQMPGMNMGGQAMTQQDMFNMMSQMQT